MTDADASKKSTQITALIDCAQAFYGFGWQRAQASLSLRLGDKLFATAAGAHPSALNEEDFLETDLDGVPTDSDTEPVGDLDVHLKIYGHDEDAGTVLHLHHLQAALCSDRDHKRGFTHFHELSVLRALGVDGEDLAVNLPIVDFDAGEESVSNAVAQALSDEDTLSVTCLNVKNHGLYVWGENVAQARRRAEACAYLFDYSWQRPMHPKKSKSISGFNL